MTFIEWLQTRLNARGYNSGEADGVFGRKTRNALLQFQRAHSLPATGMADPATVAALREQVGAKPVPTQQMHDLFPWMAIALRKKGLLEGKDNKVLREFLKSDGNTLGDPSKLPWCGDFVETCMALALPNEVLPNNPYLARNWQKFGEKVTPCYGSVLVFWRVKRKGIQGHVGFYYAEDKTHYHVLGGNQSNSVSVARLAKDRLLGGYMPLTGGPYRRIKVNVAATGAVSANEA